MDDPKGEQWTLIVCETKVLDDQLVIKWEYSQALYKRATIERLADRYLDHLQNLIQIGRTKQPVRPAS